MLKRRECKIQNNVQIICPICGTIVELPMCKAVNGETIYCDHCQENFTLRM